ncbi:hypothetical protein IEO21_02021 [Rhodonia placenta]|uniref:Uncharacterized protein n=1 Tax=Rhodonia placenta TaxID=104341 RepID=A0A8H7U5B0_9APHY|nr:hypothetical protein IEO21_02021 [Postia placenta]
MRHRLHSHRFETLSLVGEDRGSRCLLADCSLYRKEYISRGFENALPLSTYGPSSRNPAVAVAVSL